MAHKRVLVLGAVLVAAGIAVPTTAILTQGGALSEPRTPVVEPTTPAPPPEPPEVPVAVTSPTVEPLATSTAPRRVRAGAEVPSHLGEEDPPPRRRPADPADPAAPVEPPATRTAAPPDPARPDAPDLPEAETPETPPDLPAETPDPADEGTDTGVVPPPPAEDDQDPADQ